MAVYFRDTLFWWKRICPRSNIPKYNQFMLFSLQRTPKRLLHGGRFSIYGDNMLKEGLILFWNDFLIFEIIRKYKIKAHFNLKHQKNISIKLAITLTVYIVRFPNPVYLVIEHNNIIFMCFIIKLMLPSYLNIVIYIISNNFNVLLIFYSSSILRQFTTL